MGAPTVQEREFYIPPHDPLQTSRLLDLATTKESDTAKEQPQSSNEELIALNDELLSENTELGLLANNLSNLLVGADIPVVVLGANRRIRSFTPAAAQLLNLIFTDVGRPIGEIKPDIDILDLDQIVSEAIAKACLVEREVQHRDGGWYSLRIRPHRTTENRIGAVMALIDIDTMKRGLERVNRSRDRALSERDLSATLLDLSGALVVVRDSDGRTLGFNRACQKASGYTLSEVKHRRLWDFLLDPEEAEQAEVAFTALRDGVETVRGQESSWIGKDGSRKVIAWSHLAHRNADSSIRNVISTGVDITQRTLMEGELLRSEKKLRRLTASLFTTQEEERKRLARELHDDVNQRLGMLANEVDLLDQNLPDTADLIRQQLRSLRETVGQLSDDLRRVAHQLHPSALEHFGLVAALESYCPDFSKLHSIKVKFTHRGIPDTIPANVSLSLYRIAQECLQNAAKHSGAKTISLVLTADKGEIVLAVADKGAGFDPVLAEGQSGLGLVGIRERARLAGGSITICSSPGKGTQIEVRLPLDERGS